MSSSGSFYNIVITNANSSADLAAPSDGFVDSMTLENYDVSLETTPNGLTFALSTAKRRANIRYREIILQMNFITNAYIMPATIVQTGGSITTPPTSIAFQLVIDHGDSSLYTADELNPGQFLSGVNALARMIARGLQYSQAPNGSFGNPIINIFDPTSATTPGNTTSVPRTGERIESFTVGPLASNLTTAAALITITPVLQTN